MIGENMSKEALAQKEQIVERLKENGCRITKQRLILLDVILSSDWDVYKRQAMEIASMVTTYEQNHKDITTPSDIMIIGADTIVSYEDKILGKPKDEDAAKEMLSMLSGKAHSVYTVSYTHLDVYKRQSLSCMKSLTGLWRNAILLLRRF